MVPIAAGDCTGDTSSCILRVGYCCSGAYCCSSAPAAARATAAAACRVPVYSGASRGGGNSRGTSFPAAMAANTSVLRRPTTSYWLPHSSRRRAFLLPKEHRGGKGGGESNIIVFLGGGTDRRGYFLRVTRGSRKCPGLPYTSPPPSLLPPLSHNAATCPALSSLHSPLPPPPPGCSSASLASCALGSTYPVLSSSSRHTRSRHSYRAHSTPHCPGVRRRDHLRLGRGEAGGGGVTLKGREVSA